jgi:hypothetical protein
VRGGLIYLENCGSCDLKTDCRWCPAYGYLEHGDYSAKVEYLCEVAKERFKFIAKERIERCRHYRIGGITLKVISDLSITDATFSKKFKPFEVGGPGEDMVTIRHHFSLPNLKRRFLGEEVYRKPPWAIFKRGHSWIYLGISSSPGDKKLHKIAVFNDDYSRARIYNNGEKVFRTGDLHSLTLFPTDQIMLSRLLADREGCIIHSSGVVFDGRGLLFVGHSEAGKSTMVKMLMGRAEILCDGRIIVRKHSDGFRMYGTWSHSEVADVSPGSAPLSAVLFLDMDNENRVLPMERKDAIRRLLGCIIKPFVTEDWWNKTISVLERIALEVPCYSLHFDKNGDILDLLGTLMSKTDCRSVQI